MICEAGDVVVTPFPFVDIDVSKFRPALVLTSVATNNAVGSTLMAMITSAVASQWLTDVVVRDWREAGLRAPSIVRPKLFTLENRLNRSKAGLFFGGGPNDRPRNAGDTDCALAVRTCMARAAIALIGHDQAFSLSGRLRHDHDRRRHRRIADRAGVRGAGAEWTRAARRADFAGRGAGHLSQVRTERSDHLRPVGPSGERRRRAAADRRRQGGAQGRGAFRSGEEPARAPAHRRRSWGHRLQVG